MLPAACQELALYCHYCTIADETEYCLVYLLGRLCPLEELQWVGKVAAFFLLQNDISMGV